MAVNTTVEVVMPPMGDSVSEGSILEWHKQEGDEVAEDETLVEISTDKVDAEVPAPVAGTVVKIHAAEGDTVNVGAVLAEIAPGENGAKPAMRGRRAGRRRMSRPAEAKTIEIAMPAMGESVSEGTILEWAKQPGDDVAEDETIVEISTDKVDAEVPAPASGTITELLAEAGDTVHVGQVIARMTSGNGAKPAAGARSPSRPRCAPPATPRRSARPRASRSRRSPRASPPRTGSTSSRSRAPAPTGASARPTCSRSRRTARRARPRAEAKQTLLKGASAMLARYMDESRAIPTATSFRTFTVTNLDARRKQLKEAGHRVSFTHLIAHAIARAATEQMPVMATHFAELDGKPHVIDDGGVNLGIAVDVEKKGGGRTLMVPVIKDAGRLTFPQFLDAFNELITQGAREQAHRRRPPGRERLAHQPGRHRHDRLRPAADERPGHDRRHRLDRLPARPVRDRRHDRRREGDDDDVDLRPSHHPGRRVRPVPAGGRGLSAGRARLLRAGLLRPRRRDRRRAAPRRRRPPSPRRLPPRRPSPRRPPPASRTSSCCRRSRPRCR